MFDRQAQQTGRAPWKIALAAIIATATVLVCRPHEHEAHWRCGNADPTSYATTYIHVKFRSFDEARTARAAAYEPLFTNLPVATFDDRARWITDRWFDAVLVHADPRFARLEESFCPSRPLDTPVHYTGFVVPERAAGIRLFFMISANSGVSGTRGVMMLPGAMALTRILSSDHSTAIVLTRLISPALAAP